MEILGQRSWVEEIKEILVNFSIQLLFIRDKIDNGLNEICRQNSIMVLSGFPTSLEKKLRNFFKCPSLVYMEDFSGEAIFKVNVNERFDNFLSISSTDDPNYFSILLETRLESSKLMHVEYLNHCLRRLSNILSDRHYLRAGIEKFLSEQLLSKKILTAAASSISSENGVYFELAKRLLSDALRDFHLMCAANANAGQSEFFDDFQSKCEAWRVSFYVCCVFLDADFSISN
jgi:hypothetical protein